MPKTMAPMMPIKGLPVIDHGNKPADRAHDHHALDAEIENARALDDELAYGGKQEGRGGEGDGEKDGFGETHRQIAPWWAGCGFGCDCGLDCLSLDRAGKPDAVVDEQSQARI